MALRRTLPSGLSIASAEPAFRFRLLTRNSTLDNTRDTSSSGFSQSRSPVLAMDKTCRTTFLRDSRLSSSPRRGFRHSRGRRSMPQARNRPLPKVKARPLPGCGRRSLKARSILSQSALSRARNDTKIETTMSISRSSRASTFAWRSSTAIIATGPAGFVGMVLERCSLVYCLS